MSHASVTMLARISALAARRRALWRALAAVLLRLVAFSQSRQCERGKRPPLPLERLLNAVSGFSCWQVAHVLVAVVAVIRRHRPRGRNQLPSRRVSRRRCRAMSRTPTMAAGDTGP